MNILKHSKDKLLQMALLCRCKYHAELFTAYCMMVVLRHQSVRLLIIVKYWSCDCFVHSC